MGRIRHEVTVHPETVAKGEKIAKKAQAERRASKRTPKAPEPEVVKRYRQRPPWMNKQVWNEALRLAGGDYKRVVIDSSKPDEALVVNRG